MWATLQPETLAKLPREVLNGVSPAGHDAGKPSLGASEADGWKRCIDALLEIRLLEDDWDGQGSPAPVPEVVDSALILAVLLRHKHVKPPGRTVQTVQGTVLFHWQWPDATMFEIDVTEPDVADVFLMAPNRPCQHWQIGGGVAV